MKLKLVEDWRNWWRWWSVRLAGLASGAIVWVTASPESSIAVIMALPAPLRIAAGVGFGVLFLLSRVLKQEKLDVDAEA